MIQPEGETTKIPKDLDETNEDIGILKEYSIRIRVKDQEGNYIDKKPGYEDSKKSRKSYFENNNGNNAPIFKANIHDENDNQPKSYYIAGKKGDANDTFRLLGSSDCHAFYTGSTTGIKTEKDSQNIPDKINRGGLCKDMGESRIKAYKTSINGIYNWENQDPSSKFTGDERTPVSQIDTKTDIRASYNRYYVNEFEDCNCINSNLEYDYENQTGAANITAQIPYHVANLDKRCNNSQVAYNASLPDPKIEICNNIIQLGKMIASNNSKTEINQSCSINSKEDTNEAGTGSASGSGSGSGTESGAGGKSGNNTMLYLGGAGMLIIVILIAVLLSA
jgi:ribosomal protein L31